MDSIVVLIIVIPLLCFVFYYIICDAVKRAILEAHEVMKKQEESSKPTVEE